MSPLVQVEVQGFDSELDLANRRQLIFEKRLDAKLRIAYLKRLSNWRHRFEFWLPVIGTVTASSTFVSLVALQQSGPAIVLSLGATVVGAISTALLARSPLAAWRELGAAWTRREAAWQPVWLQAQAGKVASWPQLDQLCSADLPHQEKDSTFPEYQWLIRRVQSGIKHAEGLE